jgi:ADP-heptose:LPS heptosyltransferase
VAPSQSEARELSHLLCNRWPAPPPSQDRHRVERALSLLPVLGIPSRDLGARTPEYPTKWAQSALPPGKGRRILLHPGASPKAKFKRWAPEAFGALSQLLARKSAGDIQVVGGPGEEELVTKVVQASEGAARALPTPPGLRELGGLLRMTDLFVGADSGPGNLASVLGVPVVLLYGPKDPMLYGPRRTGVAVRVPLDCSPCGKRSCPLPKVRCLEELQPQTVAQACTIMLRMRRRRVLAASGPVRVVLQE